METSFTPWSGLAGGVLIGLSAVMLLALNGRIAGISGIVGGLLARPATGDVAWRAAFLAGLVLAPLLYSLVTESAVTVALTGSAPLLIAGGLLVGFGSRLGSGCTSGHGVCGLGRRSPRALAAVGMFMLTGLATVLVARHVVGF